MPTFGLTAWYVSRAWPTRMVGMSAFMIVIASVLSAVVEPAWEYWVDGAPFDWAFGPQRLSIFAAFVSVGVATHIATLPLIRGASRSN